MEKNIHIELQSLVDSHEQPFVIINRDYHILAVNHAYEKMYGALRGKAVGSYCYEISHGADMPCWHCGEDCPHVHLFEQAKQHSCLHTHATKDHRMHQVSVTAYPLLSSDGELYMGELIREVSPPADRRSNGLRMIGQTPQFLACIQQLNMVAATDIQVLLQGETGTGKEMAASYIHHHSSRTDMPFITVDCTALTDTLFETEVFGHARGAFTGSVGEKVGLFAEADGGSLFLDEIGELPASQQAKLLRVLETGKYRRVGGKKVRSANVRLICATNRHLWEEVMAGRFRDDLYYRIACLSVRLPSLRERLEDVPALAINLLESIGQSMQQSMFIVPEALEKLKDYQYPGNVRELRNILFIAATHCTDNEIGVEQIDFAIGQLAHNHDSHNHQPGKVDSVLQSDLNQVSDKSNPKEKLSGSLQDVEANYINDLLIQYLGNRKQVAKAMNISERSLYRKLKRYNLN